MAGGSDGRPNKPVPRGPRPKTGIGFGSVSSINTGPPPYVQQPWEQRIQQPTEPPQNSQPNVPSQPPAPNQGAFTTGPDSFVRPPLQSNPFSGVHTSQSTNIFGYSGPRPSEMDKILEDWPDWPDTPTKTNQMTFDEVYDLVENALNDENILQQFRNLVSAARGNKSVEQRKAELRTSIQPWIQAGLRYAGPRRPGLYLPDGTRNPERAPRDAPGGPPPPPPAAGTGPGGPRIPPAGTGKPPSRPGTNPRGSTVRPPGRKGPQTLGGSLKNKSSGIGKDPSPGRRKDSSKDTAKSPLSRPPLTTENVQSTTGPPTGTGPSDTGPPQGPPKQTGPRTAAAGWRRRDDLFEASVMDEAGITWADGEEVVTALPTLQSTIDYNTENWE